ncbi:MAG: Na+/H+ antiporter NhaC family protein [Oscillospiraceae bacterium]|nr:Na+/H+ antiporter NhaC family protein [Oscillospiraceae bacterium]
MGRRNEIRGRRLLITVTVCVILMLALSLAVAAADGDEGGSALYGTFWALVPPILAIVLALITKEAYSSLFIGVVLGALLAAGGNPVGALNMTVSDDGGMIAAIADNAGIFLFLVLLGIIVGLVNLSGGSAAFGRWAEKNIKTRVGAQIATFVLGVLIFIDDYFNCLTVGSVMRPVTDSHRVSRAKLSYLIDATAAPICMIAPVSSWAAAVSGVADDLDTGISGIQLFIRAIPYNFYSLLTFVFIIGLVVMKFDYGPMQLHEMAAQLSGELGGLENDDESRDHGKGRVLDLILPVVVLIICCTVGMLYVGGFFGTDWWGGTDCAGDFIGAFGNTDAFVGLPWGSIVALIIIVIYMLCRRVLTFKEAMECVPKGFISMVPAMTILTLAVSLKNMTSALGAADFVHDVMEGAAGSLFSLLPAVIFVVAVILAFASGTSWGTFGILIPIVLAVFPADSKLLIIGISACLAGAVCGDHCSPISDTTIMASAGAQIEHINHVSTQLPYALTVAGVSFVTYIFAGFIQNAIVSLIIGAALTVGTLFVLRTVFAKKKA